MIGVGIITYNRPEEFSKIVDSIKNVDHLVCVKDGGKPKYTKIPECEFAEFSENKGVGNCKNWLIENLLAKNCEHIFLVEDDCLIKNNEVWEYCISFSKESGLLHFNWNDYRHKRFSTAIFDKHKAALCHDTEANFSYFHSDFLKDIRFDTNYINAWEHIDIEIQGENKGFLPPFRTFISPSELGDYLELIDNGISTITGKEKYHERVVDGHHYFEKKWGKKINDFQKVDMKTFYDRMKEITQKYSRR